jgi:hypothetical protein
MRRFRCCSPKTLMVLKSVGRVLIYFTEHSIGVACHLPMQGEIWWKKGELYVDLYKQFLLPEHHDPD